MVASVPQSRGYSALIGLLCVLLCYQSLDAAPRTWIGGNVDWVETAGADPNWNPNLEPDIADEAIFNTSNSVNLGAANSIQALTMSGGIDLNTNAQDLTVDGLIQLIGASTNLTIGSSASAVQADSVTINSGGRVSMTGGSLTVIEETGNGLLDINAGGTLSGYGTVSLTDGVVAGTVLLSNDGLISAQHAPLIVIGDPIVDTLTITLSSVNARIDLDGAGNSGGVSVNRNQTLDINGTLSDAYGGAMTLGQISTLDISTAWTLDTGTITADNGFVDSPFPTPDIPAGNSTIAGGAFTQTGGTINVVDTDGVLQFDAPFTMNGGNLVNNGLVIFNADATIAAAANLTMPTTSSSLTVGVGRVVTINQTNFDIDGGGNPSTNIMTVESDGLLTINVTDYDDDAINRFDSIITLNSGDISVTTGDAETIMDGTLNMNLTTPLQLPEWSGEPLDIGDDGATGGPLDADINVTGTGISRINSQVDFNSDADVKIAAGAQFDLAGTTNFQTVNGANNASFTGTGEIMFTGPVNVLEAVTLNMVGGAVDLDGQDIIGDTINIDAAMVINAQQVRSFGRTNGGGGVNTLDVNNSVGTGVLTVNLDVSANEWTLNAQGVMNLVNDNTEATLLAGNAVNINGTVNVTGDVRTTARLDIGSTATININTASQPLRLAGGSLGDPNMLLGGTISGAGALGADTGIALHGHGTINSGVDFDGASNLFADNGTLTINGSILDVNRIGTNDVDGVLNVVNAWNTSVASFVTLDGGTIQGGTMTIDNVNTVSGFGTITSRVIINTGIRASGGTLVLQTAGNDNDWDGATNDASLNAQPNSTLELRDNATFGFTGVASTFEGGKVFANGFALDFNPGSNLALGAGTYESTHSTDIGGAVNINVAESTIKVANNFFLTFESGSATTLNANLRLLNNNINIEAGATFSGAGALIIPDGSHVVGDNGANINVLVDNEGAFRPGNFEGIGTVTVKDYQQTDSGEIYVEIRGTLLNQFDRVVSTGVAQLDGYLNVDIDEVSPGVPFVPALGNTFNIISATGGVVGTFDTIDMSGMPAGLTFHINYLANAVQLQVVNKPIFSADFDDDGDVDATDYQIWRHAFKLNQLGDANGDNISDGADYVLWRDQFGSHPGAGSGAGFDAAAVPEPAGALLFVMGLVALVGRRRGSR